MMKRANTKSAEGYDANFATTRPRLVKAAELVARQAAEAEAERAKEIQAKEKPIVVRTPRNAIEARDVFNSLFNAA